MHLRVEQAAKSKRKREIRELYLAAFAREDRMPFWMMLAMSRLRHTEFLSFYDGDSLCGFVYLATIGRVTFVMFLAVAENLRSRGYGGRILHHIAQTHPNRKLIVSIEPCGQSATDGSDLEERIRRRNFYLKNGFAETGYLLRLGKEQEILIKNGEFDKREFQRFFLRYSNFTMYPKIDQISDSGGA